MEPTPLWKDARTLQEGFCWALEALGQDALKEPGRVLALFADGTPELARQAPLAQNFFAAGAHTILLAAAAEAPESALLALARAEEAVAARFIAPEAANLVCTSFWAAISAAPAPRPEPLSYLEKPLAQALAWQQEEDWGSRSLADCRTAALHGVAAAQMELAGRLTHGCGGADCDPENAYYWYTEAFSNQPEACWHLGQACEKGFGTEKSTEAAADWYRTGADMGSTQCMYALGGLWYKGGFGEPELEKQGLVWLEKAALAGHTGAMVQLAMACGWGHGTEKDTAKARLWLTRAVQAGEDRIAPDLLKDFQVFFN
ncbi:MAG: sel1 repeat family protein [Oscillospiraceae bacterium]|nr:sel1 repeat family protein [Oscillospiraceae bacterium]